MHTIKSDDHVLSNLVEVFIGTIQYYDEEKQELLSLHPMDVNIKFFTQNEFKNYCGIRQNDAIIQIKLKDNAAEYIDYFQRGLLDIDDKLITDRGIMFDICRVTLPSFYIRFKDDFYINIEAFVTFYNNNIFTITYVYNEIEETMSQELIYNLFTWSEFEHIFFDELMMEKLRFRKDNAVHTKIDKPSKIKEDKKYWGVDRKSLEENGLALEKVDFMLEFLFSYLKDDKYKITYNLFSMTYRFYNIYNKSTGKIINKENESILLRKIIEARPNYYEFNDNIHNSFVNVSALSNHFLYASSDYTISIRYKEKNEDEDIIEYFNQQSIHQLYAVVEHHLINKTRIMSSLSILKKELYQDLSKDELHSYKNQLIDLESELSTFNFEIINCVYLSETIKHVLRVDTLTNELTFLYNKIENSIDTKNSIQNEKLNKIFQFIAIIISLPAITEVIDLLFDAKQNADASISTIARVKLFILIFTIAILCFINFNKHLKFDFRRKLLIKIIGLILIFMVITIIL